MKNIIAQYNMQSNNQLRCEERSLELQLTEDSNTAKLSKEVAEKTHELRRLNGDDLEGLEINELVKLENKLEASLSRVLETKGKRIMNDIATLQEKGLQLMEENQKLKQKMAMMSQEKGPFLEVESLLGFNVPESNMIMQTEGQSSESVVTNRGSSSSSDDCSDTSLNLRLGF
ncbi:hypothetical protein Dimus_006297 [Dionaea muscipula]